MVDNNCKINISNKPTISIDNGVNIEDYDGINTKEKYILYCNEKNYKEKLESLAKSECYNKTKELKD